MLSFVALFSLTGLLAVWVIYPVVIAALAALVARRRAVAAIVDASEPTVSVIIATRDDADTLRARIADCFRASYDPALFDVVVAIDRQASVAAADFTAITDRVTIVAGDEPGGKAAALNAAVRASRGEILVFADAHQRFHPDAIRELVAALRTPRVGAVSGSLELPRTDEGKSLAARYWMLERWLRRCEAAVHSSVGVTGAIWAQHRSLWSPLPPLLILDDLYAPMRLVLRGYRVGFAQSARAVETRHHDAAQEYRRKVRTLTGVIQLCTWLPLVMSPIHNPIWLQFTVHKLLRLLTPYWVAAIGLWVIVVFARSLAESLWVVVPLAVVAAAVLYHARSGFVKRAWEIVVSGTLLQAAAIVGTVNGFRGRWNVWATSVRMNEQK